MQDDEVLVLGEQLEAAALGKLAVGLIDQHERVARVQDAPDVVDAGRHAGRVVGAREHDDVDIACGKALDRLVDVDVEVVADAWAVDDLGARELGVRLVDREGRREVEHLAARSAPGDHDVVEQLVAAVAAQHVLHLHAPVRRDRPAQAVGERIGVAIERELPDTRENRVLDLGRDVKRALVGRDEDVCLHVLGIVGNHALQRWR